MKRRTLRKHRAEGTAGHHHNVYVVLLDPAAGKLRKVRAANPARLPDKPCVYVGMTGLTPEERFTNHKRGIKDAWVVKRSSLALRTSACTGDKANKVAARNAASGRKAKWKAFMACGQ